MNTTEKYIRKAVDEAKKELSGTNIQNCNIQMDMHSDGAAETLAEALLKQAEANEANSKAMMALAHSLKPTDACVIKVVQDNLTP